MSKVKEQKLININFIEEATGGGKTQYMIDNCDSDSLIVTYTITLAEEIKRRITNNRCKVIHYHQLIWDTGKQIGMPLSLGNSWGQYDNEFIFEEKNNRIKKYSKIFVDIEAESLEENWRKIIHRYFLKEDGEIFIAKDLSSGKSLRLNNPTTNFLNALDKKYQIEPKDHRTKSKKIFYISLSGTSVADIVNMQLQIMAKYLNKVTILASNLEVLKDLEETLNYPRHISFLTNSEEQDFTGTSLALHWKKKNKHIAFDKSTDKLKMSTVKNFKGLESDIVFYFLDQNDYSLDKFFYSAITRASDSVYIFNKNVKYSELLRLNTDAIIDQYEEMTSAIYLSIPPKIKKNILNKYFTISDNNINKYESKINLFFQRIFPQNQKLQFLNYGIKNGQQQLAITHLDTNLILIVEQAIVEEGKEKKNYFLCKELKINKNYFFYNSETDGLWVESYLSVPKNCSHSQCIGSQVKYDNQDLSITNLVEKINQYPVIKPIEETQEYKKWILYLDLLEESKIFKVKIIDFNKKSKEIVLKKLTKTKVENKSLLGAIYNNSIIKIGTVIYTNMHKIVVETDKNFDQKNINTDSLSIGLFGDLIKITQLKEGMQKIKTNEFRYYIFGEEEQKIPKIEKLSSNIKFKNNQLNDKQKDSIVKAMSSKKLFMIQGPPGTGKTSIIAELTYQAMKKNMSIFITSESNDAIENALKRLVDKNLFYPLLIQGKERQKKEFQNLSLPTEKNCGVIYKQKVLQKLKSIIDPFLNYKKEKQSVSNMYQKYIDEGYDELNMNRECNREISNLKEKFFIKVEDDIFLDIREELYAELKVDKSCLKDFTNMYIKKVNVIGGTLMQSNKAIKILNDIHLMSNNTDDPVEENDKTMLEKFDMVLVDEVSKALPIELNLAILKAKKIVLIGDQKQLPPMYDKDLEIRELAENIYIKNEMEDITQHEILVELREHKTVFERLIENNGHAHLQLTTQYRMHEDIQEAINQFYDEPLECGIESHKKAVYHQLFDRKSLVWIDTSNFIESEKKNNETSFENKNEIQLTNKILDRLNSEYKNTDIHPSVGIISFYGKQALGLQKLDVSNYDNLHIDFGTVDTFQGQERDFIIVSMVRSNNSKDIGFARSPNRINVAFSRAKNLLIILGSVDTFTKISNRDKQEVKKAKEIYKKIYDLSHKGKL